MAKLNEMIQEQVLETMAKMDIGQGEVPNSTSEILIYLTSMLGSKYPISRKRLGHILTGFKKQPYIRRGKKFETMYFLNKKLI